MSQVDDYLAPLFILPIVGFALYQKKPEFGPARANVWRTQLHDVENTYLLEEGSTLVYDGSRLAKRGDVVVVTLNYRLGALGYLN